mmetsp:Transcript_15128/g.39315  ORF Transcript_15128/g.39315 Transcript_15128/m.39315 type:complete len:107 (+) Transcript_15128:70-390(+)
MADFLSDMADWELDPRENDLLGSDGSDSGPDKDGFFHMYKDGFCAETQVKPPNFADDMYDALITNVGGSAMPGPCRSDSQWDPKTYSYKKAAQITMKITAYESTEK